MKAFRFQVVIAILDWIALVTTYQFVSAWHMLLVLPGRSVPFFRPEIYFVMAFAAVGLMVFHYNNLYSPGVIRSGWDQISRISKSMMYLCVALIALSFVFRLPYITESRFVVILFTGVGMAVVGIERLGLIRPVLRFLARVNVFNRNVLIIGAGQTGRLLAANLTIGDPYGLRIVGFLDDTRPPGSPVFRGITVVGPLSDLETAVESLDAEETILCVEDMPSNRLVDLFERCQRTGTVVKIASPLHDLLPSMRFTEKYGRVPLIGLSQTQRGSAQEIYKRAFDLLFGSIGIILLSPLYLAIAIAIRATSPGPVLYAQDRIGRDGVPFKFFKFRSMLVGSDNDPERVRQMTEMIRGKKNAEGSTKIVNESRVTPIGRFLRKTSLDELPQLFNVLKGEMSLVGPRPCLPYEWEQYEDWHRRRLAVVPGCTGLWQVSGRSAVGFDDMVVLDLYYIQNASLFLDLQLIFKTIPVMVYGRGGK